MTKWTRLLSPDDGGGGGDDSGGGEGGGAAPAADILGTSLGDAESIPAKFRGKTVKDILGAYDGAQSKITTLSSEMKTLQEKIDSNPGVNQGFFRELLDGARESGEAGNDDIERAAQMLGVPNEDVQDILSYVNDRFTNTIKGAQQKIDESHKQEGEESSGIEVPLLLEWANQNEAYSPQDLDAFNRLIRRGSVEPFNMIIEDMTKAGIDPRSLKPISGKKDAVTKLPTPRRGMITEEPAEKVFKTRTEYRKAADAARGNPDQERIVKEILKRSPIKSWPERHTVA